MIVTRIEGQIGFGVERIGNGFVMLRIADGQHAMFEFSMPEQAAKQLAALLQEPPIPTATILPPGLGNGHR